MVINAMEKSQYKDGMKGIDRHDIDTVHRLVKGGPSSQVLFEQRAE